MNENKKSSCKFAHTLSKEQHIYSSVFFFFSFFGLWFHEGFFPFKIHHTLALIKKKNIRKLCRRGSIYVRYWFWIHDKNPYRLKLSFALELFFDGNNDPSIESIYLWHDIKDESKWNINFLVVVSNFLVAAIIPKA